MNARVVALCGCAGWLFLSAGLDFASAQGTNGRIVLGLDGNWQIAQGSMERPPMVFDRTVPVPGLVTLATPPFDSPPGPPVADRKKPVQPDPAREAFWYRRTFRLDRPVPAVARLKVNKAMFTSRVMLNGRLLGEHDPSFTPGYFDAREALQPGENVLLIRVGASPSVVPRGFADAREFEKARYIPGIFDSVQLLLSGTPCFEHVQVAPDIARQEVRVQIALRNTGPARQARVACVVREATTNLVVGRAAPSSIACAEGADSVADVRIPIADCRLWSPEDPFLYRLEVESDTDRYTTRFGMREFAFDPKTRRPLLNGRPYFMRGTNFTLYRFFEDPECGDLPWRDGWVRLLHQRVKEMNWNCVRYCIGFPPEAWYDAADELGILVQDEFPVWGIGAITASQLATEYAEWLRERWNHPSVVIWDAQNETRSPITGEALAAVRGLDLSGRPWDNGWGAPVAGGDSWESHPYHYSNPCFTLADMSRTNPVPRGGPGENKETHAVILNEYGWLWLNRDGTPTKLTAGLYDNLAGPGATAAQRRHVYATHFAADTEFWRSHRRAAAVMHFTTLGYSHPDGQTSDHWINVPRLEWEPEFRRYVRDAFAPVGLMIDFWRGTAVHGTPARIPVRLVNDLAQPWSGAITLSVRSVSDGRAVVEERRSNRAEAHGQAATEFSFTWPKSTGAYVLEAKIQGSDGSPVRSVREVQVIDLPSLGLALGRVAAASSSASDHEAPDKAVDGNPETCWTAATGETAWLTVDLREVRRIGRVRIAWGLDRSAAFAVEVSRDAQDWREVGVSPGDMRSVSELHFAAVEARHVRVRCTQRRPAAPGGWPAAQRSHTIRELQVFE